MKRKIIKIDEKKCNGCGICIPDCPEGALQVIDGKVRLVSDLFCDGLGACIKSCPENAITIETREATPYDEFKVMENVSKCGSNVIKAHLKHLYDHNEKKYLEQAIDFLNKKKLPIPSYVEKLKCGCSGTMIQKIERETKHSQEEVSTCINPELKNWPIQLNLLNSNSSFFKNSDLLIAADCVPFSYPNFHQKILKGKILIIFCPKLDSLIDEYVQKLAEIFKSQSIKSISLAYMEVPCCGGVETIIKKALMISKQNILIKKHKISIKGLVL